MMLPADVSVLVCVEGDLSALPSVHMRRHGNEAESRSGKAVVDVCMVRRSGCDLFSWPHPLSLSFYLTPSLPSSNQMALLWDKEFAKWVKTYAKDEAKFFDDFAKGEGQGCKNRKDCTLPRCLGTQPLIAY